MALHPFWWSALLLAAGLTAPGRAFALDPDRRIDNYAIETWRAPHPLTQGTVKKLAQTVDGHVWLGTLQGLIRFNGAQFETFGPENVPALKSFEITSLLASKDGGLWIGTYRDLVKVHRGIFSASSGAGAPNGAITALHEEADGSLLVGHGKGLMAFKEGRWSVRGATGLWVMAINQRPGGPLWIGTNRGLARLEGERAVFLPQTEDEPVTSLWQGTTGPLWAAGKSLLRIDDDFHVERIEGKRDSLVPYASILGDQDGNIWLGGDRGLTRYRDGEFQTLSTRRGSAPGRGLSVLEDREAGIWYGTDGGGLSRLDDRTLHVADDPELASAHVRTVTESNDGTLFVGLLGEGLLVKPLDEKVRRIVPPGGLTSWTVFSVQAGNQGEAWIGSDNGLDVLRNGLLAPVHPEERPLRTSIRALQRTSDGVLWVGTESAGLGRIEGGAVKYIPLATGGEGNNIWAIAEARQGGVWVAVGNHIVRVNGEDVTPLRPTQSLPVVITRVLSLHEDGKGRLWIGTIDAGLLVFDHGRFTVFDKNAGLTETRISSIVEDDLGHLWLGSARGVVRVSFDALTNTMRSPRLPLVHSLFDRSDADTGVVVTLNGDPTAAKGRDGRIWFATRAGLMSIDSRQVRTDTLAPPVVIESATIDQHPISLDGNSDLPPGPGKLDISYAALTFSDPHRARFRYRLEGFDATWVEAGSRRSAHYTNLPPGRYRFLVRGANRDGIWSDKAVSVVFQLLPHFHQTLWFALAIGSVVATAVIVLFRVRVGQLRARYADILAERSRVARALHDTILQGMSGVAIQVQSASECVTDRPARAKQQLAVAVEMVQQSLSDIRRFVSGMRVIESAGTNLALSLQTAASRLTTGHQTQTSVDVKGQPFPLPNPVQNSMFYMAQEAITNAVKHAAASHIEVVLEYLRPTVRLIVRDDGHGLTKNHEGPATGHFGLQGLEERAADIGAKLAIGPRTGGGTEIEIVVRVQTAKREKEGSDGDKHDS